MKRLLGCVTLLALASCAAPGPSVPEETAVPVSQPCHVEIPDCGTYALDHVSEADRLIVIGRAAIAEIRQREACELRLRAALKACAK